MEKKKIGIKINPEIWNDFKEYIGAIQGKQRGMIAKEVEKALSLYMKVDYGDAEKFLSSSMGGPDEQKRKNKNMFKVTKREYFYNRFKETCVLRQEVNKEQIDHLCFVCDYISDSTVAKRVKELEIMGWIEPIKPGERWKNNLYRPD